MCAYSPQNRENGNFLYKFARKVKFWGFTDKVDYRCTTTILLLCSDTITLLRSVSVVTNFVIPKRDKQKIQTKNITLFGLQPAHDPRSPPYMVIQEVRIMFEPPQFFDLTSSFAARGIENLCENATTPGYAYNSVDCLPKMTKLNT